MADVNDQQAEIARLERLLAEASEQTLAAFKSRDRGKTYKAAHAAELQLERQLAAAKGEPYAIPLDFPLKWDIGAPLPHLVCNDYKTFLCFLLNMPDPDWDGSYVTIKSAGGSAAESLALVEFKGCMSVKFGAPNDEVFHGHPLAGRGQSAYTAQLVVNSTWLAELQKINSVHQMYNPELWKTLNHYVLWFHDSTFECIAQSFDVEVYKETFASVLGRMCARLIAE